MRVALLLPSVIGLEISGSGSGDAGVNAWPGICKDAAHSSWMETGRNSPWAGVKKVAVKWKHFAGGEAESSPVVSATKVYGASTTGEIFALNKRDGKKAWSYKAENQVLASPVLAGGMVMIGSDDQHFYALDQETGEFKWRYKAGEFTGGATADEKDKVVYAGSAKGLYAYGFDGKRKFLAKTKGAVNGSPALDKDRNIVFGDDKGYVYKVDRTGKLLWSHKFVNGVRSPPVITSGDMFLSNGDPDETASGQIVRMTHDGKVVWASNCEGSKNKCDSCWTAPQPVGNVVVAGCGLDTIKRGFIWGVDYKTGDVKWKVKTGNDCQTSSPVHLGDGKTVVLGCTDGTLYAVNAETGDVSWKFQTGKGIWATPALDTDGTLYVASHDGNIYALVPDDRRDL